MAITAEDEAVIERHLTERYALVRRDSRRTRSVSVAFAISVLAVAAIIVVVLRNALAPMFAEFDVSHSMVSKLAFGLWLPVTLAFVIFITLAMPFVPRLSRVAYKWNLVACWAGAVAAGLVVLASALGMLRCLS